MGYCKLYKMIINPNDIPDCGVVLEEIIAEPDCCGDCNYYRSNGMGMRT